MSEYSKILNPVTTPQSEPIFGREADMKQNRAGGFAFVVDEWTRLNRFLILGSDRPTYYASAKEMTKENVGAVKACIDLDGPRVVNTIVEISDSGRAPRNDAAILALAACSKLGDEATRKLAREAMPKVCRTGTHVFMFAEFVQLFGGWGRGTRRAVADWYTFKEDDDLAYQIIKYRQRNGWTHRDLLRLSHPKASYLLGYAARKVGVADTEAGDVSENRLAVELNKGLPALIPAFEQLQATKDVKEAAALIRQFNLPREAVPTDLLKEKVVWEALLEKMPMTAMIRNLSTMTRLGLIAPLSEATKKVVEELGNTDRLRKSRVHPVALLLALKTYEQGHSMRGSSTWDPVSQVTDALNDAFYEAFANIEPTGKRWLLGIDVSGSMGSEVLGTGLSNAEAAAAMAMVTAKTEDQYFVRGFSAARGNRYGGWYDGGTKESMDGFVDLGITPSMRLDDIVRKTANMNFGATDCSLPMMYASKNKIPVDVFAVYTDNETWAGSVQPVQALKRYREIMGIDAKLIVAGFSATDVSIADPTDPGMLDVVGFDSAAPQIMADFGRGDL